MIKYSLDKKVSFDENRHLYKKGDKHLTSVTTFLSQFKNPFDKDKISFNYAKKHNLDQKEVLKDWEEKGIRSCEIGTSIHKIFEDYTFNNYSFLNGVIDFDYLPVKENYYNEFKNKKEVSLNFIKDFFLSNRLNPIESEYIVYNDYLAGQIDSICKDKNDNFYLIDFKTSKSINKKNTFKKMLGVFKEYDDCNYNHYSLQLSIYKNLLKKYKIKDMFIVHITECNYRVIKCLDFTDLIKKNNLLKL